MKDWLAGFGFGFGFFGDAKKRMPRNAGLVDRVGSISGSIAVSKCGSTVWNDDVTG
jgi:hypothetical protein